METGSAALFNHSQSLIDFSSVNGESNYSIEVERPRSKNVRRQIGPPSLPNLHQTTRGQSRDKSDLLAKTALAHNKGLAEKSAKKAVEKEATGKFVVGKMKQDELRDFISDSLTKCRKGAFKKLNRNNRDLDSILSSCVDMCNHPNYFELESERVHLAEELLSMPETFLGLRFLMKDVDNTFNIDVGYSPSPNERSRRSIDEQMVSMVDDLGISEVY